MLYEGVVVFDVVIVCGVVCCGGGVVGVGWYCVVCVVVCVCVFC